MNVAVLDMQCDSLLLTSCQPCPVSPAVSAQCPLLLLFNVCSVPCTRGLCASTEDVLTATLYFLFEDECVLACSGQD